MSNLHLVNTNYFTKAAAHFDKYGYYTDAPEGSLSYEEYWDEEKKRCLEGYSVGGVKITGYHYYYLNYSRMTEKGDKEIFPRFWDSDYDLFWCIDICQNGIELADYKKLQLGVKIKETSLKGGRHLVIAKARGKGYSFKGSSLVSRNYNLIKKSKGFIIAGESEYLDGADAIMNKVQNTVAFNAINCAWGQPEIQSQLMHRISGYKENIKGNWVPRGFLSEIAGVTTKGNPDRARGKRGKIILFEEAGSFAKLTSTFEKARPSVEQDSVVYGTIIVFGTGGDMKYGQELENMFYNPDSYNCLEIENQWDEGVEGTFGSFFVPVTKNAEGFMDIDGNSNEATAKVFYEQQRELKKSNPDPSVLTTYVAERPYNPKEAFLDSSVNNFPVKLLQEQEARVLSKKLFRFGVAGNLTPSEKGRPKFTPDSTLSPVYDYPIKKDNNNTGCIVIYESPFIPAGETAPPKGMYYLCNDPYSVDKADTSPSIGSTYVIKKSNPLSPTFPDCIVASYNGRPSVQDTYNTNLFLLAQYYNGKIGFENNTGNNAEFARRNKQMQWLQEEFLMSENKELQSSVRRKYGMHMTEGRKDQAELYVRDWLLEVISVDEDGNATYRYQLIFDLGLLKELIKFNRKGNFDRVSALFVGMFFQREISHKKVGTTTNPFASRLLDIYQGNTKEDHGIIPETSYSFRI